MREVFDEPGRHPMGIRYSFLTFLKPLMPKALAVLHPCNLPAALVMKSVAGQTRQPQHH